MDLQTLLWSVFVPGFLAFGLVALAAAILFVKRHASPNKSAPETIAPFDWRDRVGRACLALAFAAGFLLSFHMTEGWPGWPLHSRWHWLMMIGAWSGIVGFAAAQIRERWWCTPLTAMVLAVPSGFMLQPLPIFEQPWLWRIGLMLAIAIIFLSLQLQSARHTGGWMPLAMLVAFAAGSIVIVESGFAKLGLITAAMAAACGAMTIVGLLARRLDFGPGPTAVIATLLPTLMMLGWFYNEREVPFAAFALLTIAPLSLWLSELPPLAERRFPVRRVVLWIIILALLPVIATLLAMWKSDQLPDPHDYYSHGRASERTPFTVEDS